MKPIVALTNTELISIMIVEVIIMNNRIRQFRLKSKLTQQQLADLMDVTRQAVTRWESGTVEPSTENLITLAQIFDCSVDELVGNDYSSSNEKIIIKEVLVNEEKKAVFWSINKANIFLYIVSAIAFIIYLILKFTTRYSMSVIIVWLFPIIIISTLISFISNIEEIKIKNRFLKLILHYSIGHCIIKFNNTSVDIGCRHCRPFFQKGNEKILTQTN